MSRPEPPRAVRRHRNRPLRWAALFAVFVAYVLTFDARVATGDQRRLDTGLRVRGTVAPSYRGGATVPVEYDNPLTDQTVVAEVYVTRARFLPERAGQSVDILVTREDPDIASMAGDRMSVLSSDLPIYAVLVAAPLALWLARWVGTWRARRLARSPKPTFAMRGALGPRSRFGRHCELHLYPLDAAAGSPPVCAVPLVTTAGIAVGETFPVEVKGVPRPLGRVVARVDGEVLWPAGRARPLARLAQPAVDRDSPTWRPEPVGPPGADALVTRWWGALWPYALLSAATVAAVAAVTAVTLLHAAEAEELRREGTPVLAEVVEHAGADDRLVLKYRLSPDGDDHRGRVAVDIASAWTVGRRYPAVVDPDDPSHVELLGEPYDAVEPIEWSVLPLPFALALLFDGLAARRRQRRLAGSGPWRSAWAWTTGEESSLPRVVFGPRPGAPVGVLHLSSFDTARLSCAPGGYAAVKLAGEPWPGEDVVLVRDGHVCLASGRAMAPKESDLGRPPEADIEDVDPEPAPHGQPETCRSLTVSAAWAAALVQVGFLAGLLPGIALEGLGVPGGATACGAIGAALVAARSLLISATDDGEVLTVRNVFRTYRVPWPDIEAFRLRDPWYLKGGLLVTVPRAGAAREVKILATSFVDSGRNRYETIARWARRYDVPLHTE